MLVQIVTTMNSLGINQCDWAQWTAPVSLLICCANSAQSIVINCGNNNNNNSRDFKIQSIVSFMTWVLISGLSGGFFVFAVCFLTFVDFWCIEFHVSLNLTFCRCLVLCLIMVGTMQAQKDPSISRCSSCQLPSCCQYMVCIDLCCVILSSGYWCLVL